jgi:hypothetical protein
MNYHVPTVLVKLLTSSGACKSYAYCMLQLLPTPLAVSDVNGIYTIDIVNDWNTQQAPSTSTFV